MWSRWSAAVAAVLCSTLAACATPTPNDLVVLDVPGAERYALATEDGIIALDGDDLGLAELPIVLWFRGSPVPDDAVVEQRTEDLGLLRPKSTRLLYSEFAAQEPLPGEDLYIGLVEADDPEHRPFVVDAHLYEDGEFGDLLVVDDWFRTCESIARDFAGAGVYARREGRYVLVGLLNGTVATNPSPSTWCQYFGPYRLLPFLGLEAIAPVLPRTSSFFERRARVFRPDFEYGTDREGHEPNPAGDEN